MRKDKFPLFSENSFSIIVIENFLSLQSERKWTKAETQGRLMQNRSFFAGFVKVRTGTSGYHPPLDTIKWTGTLAYHLLFKG